MHYIVKSISINIRHSLLVLYISVWTDSCVSVYYVFY